MHTRGFVTMATSSKSVDFKSSPMCGVQYENTPLDNHNTKYTTDHTKLGMVKTIKCTRTYVRTANNKNVHTC